MHRWYPHCKGCRKCCSYGATMDTVSLTYRPKLAHYKIHEYIDLSGKLHRTNVYATYELATEKAQQISTQCRHYNNR